MERIASLPALIGMWSLVLLGNITGATMGAAVLAFGGVFSPSEVATATSIGMAGINTPALPTFLRAVFAGLIVAGVVWLDFGFREAAPRLLLIYVAFLSIPMTGLFHVVVSSTEVMFLVFNGEVALLTGLTSFLIPVLLGNIVGGVVLVTVVNYFQTSSYVQDDQSLRLGLRDWLLTYNTGRTKEEIFGEDTKK